MIATLYLRSAAQNDGAISEQRRLGESCATARGWQVGEVIADNGAAELRAPPGLAILRDRISRGEAQVVVAGDVARIYRTPEQVYTFARFCRQHAANLCFIEQMVNLDPLFKAADRAGIIDYDRL